MNTLSKYSFFLIIILLTFFSCQNNEIEPLFDESSNKRASALIESYKSKLTESTNGWKGAYYPNGAQAGGYSFFLKFNKNGSLSMYSDLSIAAADRSFETTYQIKALQKPTLIFDSYSYLHELVNPDYNGGTGEFADLELIIVEVTDNKIVLDGVRNNTELVLTKLSNTEFESLSKGGLSTVLRSTLDYAFSESFIILALPTGEKVDVFFDYNSKILSAFFFKNNDVSNVSSPFITTTTGIQLRNPVTISGTRINELIWDNANKQYYFLNSGNRTNLVKSNRPSMPFYFALGYIFTDFVIEEKISEQNEQFKQVFAEIKNEVIKLSTVAPARVIGDISFRYLPQDGVFALVIDYTRTYPDGVDSFGAVLFYEPQLDNKGNISFARLSQTGTLSQGQFFNGISGIVNTGVKKFTDIIESNSFAWNYHPTESRTAVMKAIQTPGFEMKGKIY
jgi:hypothetical protein